MNLTLVRVSYGARVTLGRLLVSGLNLATLEEPWLANGAGSCVPDGDYDLKAHSSQKHPHTWALVNPELRVFHHAADVPDAKPARTEVLIHVGNRKEDTIGCILVGLTLAFEPPTLLSSQAAFAKLTASLDAMTGPLALSIRATRGTAETFS